MEEYIGKWISIIEGMTNSNTYKLAWGKAILECIEQQDDSEESVVINHRDIVFHMMKYYWNQTFFFHLNQGPSLDKKPVMFQLINDMIQKYKVLSNTTIPVWFNQGIKVLDTEDGLVEKYIGKFITVANQDVSFRFLNLRGQVIHLYDLDKRSKTVSFTNMHFLALKRNSKMLKLFINYKWVQLLEMYNHTPKIASKVESSSNIKIRRNNLSKFKKILINTLGQENIIDFYTGEILDVNDISLDHVIPWSFIYSDDLWNLVITSKRNNSSKSNKVVESTFIEKLQQRNLMLYNKLKDNNAQEALKLKESLDKNYVVKFYNDFKI